MLAMEMGLGKTLTTLVSLAWRHVWGSVDRVLIICPASAVAVWVREIHKWVEGIPITFVIVSYDFARFYFKYVRKEEFDAVVFDEIHRLKNPNSKQGNRLFRMARYIRIRIGLTGTPIGDGVIDLFSQYRAVESELLGESFKTFREKYCYRTGYMGYKIQIDKTNKQKVLQLISPMTYELKKKDVFGITVLPPVRLFAELKGTQKKLYNQLEKTTVATVGDFKVSAAMEITQMIRLQQITGGHVPDDNGKMLCFECGKADLLLDFLKNWDPNEKLVIFARYVYELDLIEKICQKAKFSCYVYNHDEAHKDEDFQNKKHPQISISQISKGISRTLTRANTIVFFSMTHSYIEYAQALGRCEARGVAKQPITPVFLLTRSTIDEDYEDSVIKKQSEARFVSSFLRKLKAKRSS